MKNIGVNQFKEQKWINDVFYGERDERLLNIMEVSIVEDDKTKDFVFVTDLKITEKEVERLVAAGRSRWKIENQGFNNQKNIRYNIEHACGQNYNAMKNHYLAVKIADIL